ncbi:MAG: chemotaxis response regulator protein-glutamate methylesterase [Nevskia sp.]|jgi:two-component system, chemotaxis family, protein-glutamate methylesterase/glutaminase|nr:chemotaxis response regulator protein-glutamate methylesterase [Nevskia sp.]MCK9384087.1 chemotaxis response regulator protein-glutamate methylesterase [Nevskia sp.]
MAIRVLIVDDSALMRQLLTEFLSADKQLEVVGTAPDPFVARDKIKQLQPDVLTLDVEMPRMDGLTFLENLMRLRPMPVVMVSSLTAKGADVTLQALELGAIDYVTKPKIDLEAGIRAYADELISKIKAASKANVRRSTTGSAQVKPMPLRSGRHFRTTEQLIAIGASTGGTEAIKAVLERMPADAPAIVITQHIPAAFSGPFAARMDRSSAMSVCEARDGQQIVPGHAYIAPGDRHLEVVRSGARYVCRLTDAPPENRHRPSVDVLFKSVAHFAGANAVGAILTGMGDDGARGLLEMRKQGAPTLVQDEASSVVWGMPGAAVKMGAADRTYPLDAIAAALLDACGSDSRAA